VRSSELRSAGHALFVFLIREIENASDELRTQFRCHPLHLYSLYDVLIDIVHRFFLRCDGLEPSGSNQMRAVS
jgi:hypothetical protein